MKIAFFYYDGFVEFEIVQAALLFHNEHETFSVALQDREYLSEERQRFLVDRTISEIDADSIDLLIIPGGNPISLIDNLEVRGFIEQLVSKNKKIGAICGGTFLLAGLGILKGRQCTGDGSGVKPGSEYYAYFSESQLSDEHVVVDGNIITAQGQAFTEFAVELANQIGSFKNREEYEECLKWFKNIR